MRACLNTVPAGGGGDSLSATAAHGVPCDTVTIQVAALKRRISEVREVPCFTVEIFVKDVEEPLDDEKPLRSLDRAPHFLLLKQAFILVAAIVWNAVY
jgi:hypothetical protein